MCFYKFQRRCHAPSVLSKKVGGSTSQNNLFSTPPLTSIGAKNGKGRSCKRKRVCKDDSDSENDETNLEGRENKITSSFSNSSLSPFSSLHKREGMSPHVSCSKIEN